MFRIIVRNAAANWFGFIVHAAVTFFLTPIVLRELGSARYGVWAVIMGLAGYYGLLDMGLRSATTQYLTRYLSKRQYDKMNESVSSVLAILSLMGTLIFTLSWVFGMLAPRWFDISIEWKGEFFWCLVIAGGMAAVQCVFFPFHAVFTATQRYDISNAIGVTTRLLSALCIWMSLYLDYGLIGLSLATAGCNMLDYWVRWIVARQLLPQLRVSLRRASWASSKEVIGFALWHFPIGAHHIIVQNSDVVIVGLFLPIVEVTIYALATNLSRYLVQLVGSGATVLYPVATHLDAQDDVVALRRLFLKSSRILFLLSVILTVVAFVWAEDFYRLWVGYESIGVKGIGSATLLYRVLSVAAVLGVLAGVPHQILLGSRRLGILTCALASHMMMNIVVSVALVQRYDSVGVAIGTLIAVVIHKSVVIPWIVCRQLTVPLGSFYFQVCTRPLIVGVLLAGGSVAIKHLSELDRWAQLFAHGAAATFLGMLLSVLLGVTRSERSRIFRPLLAVVVNRAFVSEQKKA